MQLEQWNSGTISTMWHVLLSQTKELIILFTPATPELKILLLSRLSNRRSFETTGSVHRGEQWI